MITIATQPKPGSADIHDLFLDASGNLAMARDAEAIGQHARQRIMTYRGEWFLDIQVGVPWLQQIMGQSPVTRSVLAEAVIKTELFETRGVTGIDSFAISFDRIKRSLDSYNISVSTMFDSSAQL